MDSDNWVVQNLENALNTWNTKMAEVWSLLTMSPRARSQAVYTVRYSKGSSHIWP